MKPVVVKDLYGHTHGCNVGTYGKDRYGRGFTVSTFLVGGLWVTEVNNAVYARANCPSDAVRDHSAALERYFEPGAKSRLVTMLGAGLDPLLCVETVQADSRKVVECREVAYGPGCGGSRGRVLPAALRRSNPVSWLVLHRRHARMVRQAWNWLGSMLE